MRWHGGCNLHWHDRIQREASWFPPNEPVLNNKEKEHKMNKQKPVNRVSLTYKKLPVTMVPPFGKWIVTCMTGNAAYPKPPVPLNPPVPPDPTAPVDMTTRIASLDVAIANYEDGGNQALLARNAALNDVLDGLDSLAFYVQTVARYDLTMLLTSGFQAVSKNKGQSKLDTPSITGIDNSTSTELAVHVSPVTNAIGYELQTSTNGTDWKTDQFSPQARTIIVTGLTTGTVYQVRVRALGGSTGQSDWCMPGSKIVD